MNDYLLHPQLVIVPCGARKQSRPAVAAKLYTGPYFTACYNAGRSLGADYLVILSAKHGLVDPAQVLKPYNLRMGAAGCVTAAQVRQQASDRDWLGLERVTILAGATYVNVARAVWPHLSSPLTGVGGMGKQLRYLQQITPGAKLAPQLTSKGTP